MLWHEPSLCDLLFITLNKSEALFSPSTRYRDLALGPSLFHWESQSTTTAASPTGQRTIHHEARGARVLLLVREHRREGGRAGGVTEPFRCLGFARYETTRGSGSCSSTSGDSLAAGAAHPGGVDAGDGVGGLRWGGGGRVRRGRLVTSMLLPLFVAPKLIRMGNWGGFDEGGTDCRD